MEKFNSCANNQSSTKRSNSSSNHQYINTSKITSRFWGTMTGGSSSPSCARETSQDFYTLEFIGNSDHLINEMVGENLPVEEIYLTSEDYMELHKKLGNPPKPNKKISELFEKYSDIDQILIADPIVSKLSPLFDTGNFKCGKNSLDFHLKRHALVNQEKGLSTYWCLHFVNSVTIIGYYAISASSVYLKDFPDEYREDLPNYPIPCILLGKLAVSKEYQGKGYGDRLVYDCLNKVKNLSFSLGINALIVKAIDEDAKSFYLNYGFFPFPREEKILYFPVASIPDERKKEPIS